MLSIEDELVYKTRKSLGPPKSLKLLESGPLTDKKDTIGNFLSLWYNLFTDIPYHSVVDH